MGQVDNDPRYLRDQSLRRTLGRQVGGSGETWLSDVADPDESWAGSTEDQKIEQAGARYEEDA